MDNKAQNNIEVEIRSFLTKAKYDELLLFFKKNAQQLKEDHQETFYFDCEQDLRIQRNDFYSKVWLKKGKLHDEHREEIEIKFDRAFFEKMEALFLALGYTVQIKWFRNRAEFLWNDVTVCIDFTRGYGYIIELEKMSTIDKQNESHKLLLERLSSLSIDLTPKDEFDKKFKYYKENWKSLV